MHARDAQASLEQIRERLDCLGKAISEAESNYTQRQ
jgi:hypothetical protein